MWRFHAALTSLDSGAVEMLAGDPFAAERELRMDYETLTEMGERDYMPTTAALLAEALYEQGRFDDAEAFAGISESFAASEDITSQFLWRCVRAKVAAQRGEAAAEKLRDNQKLMWQMVNACRIECGFCDGTVLGFIRPQILRKFKLPRGFDEALLVRI